jgi:hypothetical protein
MVKGHLQSFLCGSAVGTLGISFNAATTFFWTSMSWKVCSVKVGIEIDG